MIPPTQTAMRLYPRGFLLSKEGLALPDELSHYLEVRVGGMHFYHDEIAEVAVGSHRDATVLIFGHAALVEGDAATTDLQRIALSLSRKWHEGIEAFHESLDVLAGRHMIAVFDGAETFLYHDAHGMRSVYYSDSIQMAGSHAGLLEDILGGGPSTSALAGVALSVAWDVTPFEEVRSLLPNFRLEFEGMRTRRYFPRAGNEFVGTDAADLLAEIDRLWQLQLGAYMEGERDFVVSVTGGLDSRAILATARPYLGRVKTFTYWAQVERGAWTASLNLDKRIVDEILDVVPLDHRYMDRDSGIELRPQDHAVLDRNTLNHHGRWILPHYTAAFPNLSTMHLRGNLHETARRYYLRPSGITQEEQILRLGRRGFLKGDVSEARREEQLAEFASHLEDSGYGDLPLGYEPLDIFYWEVRMGRWLTEVLNETDVCFDTLTPFNMRRIVKLALAYPDEQRQDGRVFSDLVDRHYPILNFFGVNDEENLYQSQTRLKYPPVRPGVVPIAPVPATNNDVRDVDGNLLSAVPDSGGTLFLPMEDILPGRYAERGWHVPDEVGGISFTVHNEYANSKGSGRLELQLLVNGHVRLREDIAYNAHPMRWSVSGLRGGARVAVRLVALRSNPKAAWSKAGRTSLGDYRESAGNAPYSPSLGAIVSTDSPFGRLVNPDPAPYVPMPAVPVPG